MRRLFALLMLLVFLQPALADRLPMSSKELWITLAPQNDGYISSVAEDSVEPMKEMVLMTPPAELVAPVTTEKVFTSSLQREFRERYRDQFGFTFAQEFMNDPVDVSFYGNTRGYSVEEEQFRAKKRGFGEYVMKKTVEFHVDNYFKSDPQLKQVYELKEQLSNLDVKVNEQTKVLTTYDFAGNYINTTLENPNVNARVQVELAGDTTLSVWRSFSPTLNGEIYYKINEVKYSAIGRKRLAPQIESSLTVEVTDKETRDKPKENVFLLGFSLLN